MAESTKRVVFEAIDKMSENIAKMTEAMERMSARTDRAKSSIAKMTPEMKEAAKAARDLEKQTAALDKAAAKTAETMKKSQLRAKAAEAKEFQKSIDGCEKSMGSLTKVAALAAVAGIAMLGKSMIDSAVDMATAKEQAVKTFTALTGSAASGNAAFDQVLSVAQKIKMSPKDALEGVTGLLAAGFDYKEAMAVFLSSASFSKFNPAAKLDVIAKGFINIKNAAGGLMTMEGVTQLGKEGMLGVDQLMKAIGESKGMDTSKKTFIADLENMLKAGKITADEGMVAIATSMSKRAGDAPGAVGSAAAKDTSLKGLIDGIKNAPEQFMLRMSVDNGPVKAALKQINDALDPTSETGKKVAAALDSAAGKLGGFLAKLANPENITKFIDGLVSMVETIPKVVGFLIDCADAVGTVYKAFRDIGKNAKIIWDGITEAISGSSPIIKAAATGIEWSFKAAFAPIFLALAAYEKLRDLLVAGSSAGAMGKKISDDNSKIIKTADKSYVAPTIANPDHADIMSAGRGGEDILAKLRGIATGKAYAEGVGAGMASGAGVTDGASKLVAKADTATRAAAEIHSPSKRFFRIGLPMGEGLALGLGAGYEDELDGAMKGAGHPLGAMASPPGGGKSGSTVNLTVNLDGAGRDASMMAQDVANELRRLLSTMALA